MKLEKGCFKIKSKSKENQYLKSEKHDFTNETGYSLLKFTFKWIQNNITSVLVHVISFVNALLQYHL